VPSGAKLEKLEIRWPDGQTQVVTDLRANQSSTITRE
jgi:hypothetical protein